MCANFVGMLVVAGLFVAWIPRACADEIPEKYRDSVRKALDWIAKTQNRDGHWGANGDQNPMSMTGLAGMALLMEGSTLREGKYATNIRRALEFCMSRTQKGGGRDGLVGNPDNPTEAGRYMYGHGFATLFLASCYGDEDDKDRRERLKDILIRAVKYIANAQSTQGGWYYTSKLEGGDNDEGSVTITQVQALRACRNGGIPVPKAVIKKAHEYLKNSTTPLGGVVYSLGRGGMRAPAGGERPPLTAAGIACLFNAGEYKDPLCKQWFKFCCTPDHRHHELPLHKPGGNRAGHDEYTHYYFAQAMYILGDDGWDKMFPNAGGEKVTWSGYRTALFDLLMRQQSSDGSWQNGGSWGVGPIYTTSIWATVMQLDKGTLPIYQR